MINPETKKALDDLQQLIGTISKGMSAETANNTPPTDPAGGAVITKTGADIREEHIDPLRKSFQSLATVHKGYAVLGSQRVLDDPYTFLHSKSIRGNVEVYDVPDAKLGGMICSLLQKDAGKAGIPFSQWAGGQRTMIEDGLEAGLSKGLFDGETEVAVKRALTTGGGTTSGGPLIRVDIDPLLREAWLRKFPALEVIPSIPSNGLVHTYNMRTAVPDATIVAELGSLNAADGNSTYQRKASSNIAILARKTGISLKVQFAVAQSGMGGAFNLTGPDNLEVIGSLAGIARKNQALFFQGNYSGSNVATLDDEDGLYNADSFDGLRYLLKDASTSINKGSDTFVTCLNKAVAQLANAGGDVDSLLGFMSYGNRIAVNAEFQDILRVLNQAQPGGFASNLSANGFVSVADVLSKFMNVPMGAQGQGMGYYTYSATATEDISLVDPTGMAMAYLGSPDPIILELPVGYNDALSNVYIIFLMNGLVLFVPSFHRKIRTPRQVV